jgi:hypothetical protein
MNIPIEVHYRTRPDGRQVAVVSAVPRPGQVYWLGESVVLGEHAAKSEVLGTPFANRTRGRIIRRYDTKKVTV